MEMLDNDWNLINKNTPDSLSIIKLLIKAGIDINAENEYEETALELASKRSFKEVVEILQQAGADLSSKEKKNGE